MERRVFIAIFLAFLVMYVFQTYIAPPPPPQKPAAAAQRPATTPSSTGAAGAPAAAAAATASAAPAAPLPAALTSDTAEHEIVVDTRTVEVVLSNRGGRVLHWRLKDYLDDVGKPLDLVPSDLPSTEATPFSLSVDDHAISQRLNAVLYKPSVNDARIDATATSATVAFDYQDAAGLRVHKEFRFEPQSYVVTFSANVMAGDRAFNPSILWGPGLGDIGATTAGGSFFTGNYVQPPQAIFEQNDKVERLAGTKVGESPTHEGQFKFAGVDDHYFIATAVNPGQARVEFRPVTVVDAPATNQTSRQFIAQSIRVAGAAKNVRFFVGPKQFDTLQSVDQELVKAINFGIFAWLVIPLLGALKWVHSFVGNYGGSIIVLTILINLVMFPLRHKSVVSMRKMQGIQPQVKAIQDRYANLKMSDPARQKMNTEIMNLYREKGVNPASGCVPMLLTFPVLIAFYSLLQQSIELRGADFGLWIHDLSQHDPYYITPLLMGVTMFWQQRITPASVDPAQQRMMMIMPVVFTAMFLRFPSGLAIYYLVSNMFQIAQQYFTTWLIGPPVVQTPRPPAERRLKNAGTGRTAGAERRN